MRRPRPAIMCRSDDWPAGSPLRLPDTAAQEWGGSLTFYGWVPAIDIEVDANTGARTSLSVSGVDVIAALTFPFMASGEAHYGKFSLPNDTICSNMGDGGGEGHGEAREGKPFLQHSFARFSSYRCNSLKRGVFAQRGPVDQTSARPWSGRSDPRAIGAGIARSPNLPHLLRGTIPVRVLRSGRIAKKSARRLRS